MVIITFFLIYFILFLKSFIIIILIWLLYFFNGHNTVKAPLAPPRGGHCRNITPPGKNCECLKKSQFKV